MALVFGGLGSLAHAQFVPGGTLDPTTIPKYAEPVGIPPAMPKTQKMGIPRNIDYYEIAMRQFQQQVLPTGFPQTTVWGYGSINHPGTFSYPGHTIEAKVNRPVRVKWLNDLKNPDDTFRTHLFAVDQTLMWANPGGGDAGKDSKGTDPAPYTGPVPLTVHLHGAHVQPNSDGSPMQWFLPAATNIPPGFATQGTDYETVVPSEAGSAVYQYPNDQRATTLWFHDHTMGITRLNVYAGLAGFYILRGGRSDLPSIILPGPAPQLNDKPNRKIFEIPLVIQDRSFNTDGSLFYPNNRAFFEGLNVPGQPPQFPGAGELQIPFIPDNTPPGPPSDISPIWNPEAFFNTMAVNGKTWPYLNVEARRYRFRLLNGCNSRFIILKLTSDPLTRPGTPALNFWQIGTEGGFLPAPVNLAELLIAPAERADVIVDFTGLPPGTVLYLINEGPDEPFGGGRAPDAFPFADPATTGQVMKFIVGSPVGPDRSRNPAKNLRLPGFRPLGAVTNTRQVTLNEDSSATVFVTTDAFGNVVFDAAGEAFGPKMARLGTLNPNGTSNPMNFDDLPITENPALNATEIWEIYNFTADAHPIHLHQVQFQVVNRQGLETDAEGVAVQPAVLISGTIPPEVWETGFKDTVIAYPGQVTRIKAKFDIAGKYVWHCHILEHEDHEMMRPFFVGALPQ
ncbi:MAG: bilirubin oxidase [Deltaproteobacteria bacterium]|nr:bilirubin oxidase [Deltaproteobacteria bacterium]